MKVEFFEKPGCINNTRQKTLLREAGHEVVAHNLLSEAWTPDRLRPFFGSLPVAEWFNRTAPRVKSGEVVPEQLDETAALAAMVIDPLLIRRPLMAVAGECRVGFDPRAVSAWIGLTPTALQPTLDLERCPKPEVPCASPVPEEG